MTGESFSWNAAISEVLAAITSVVTVVLAYRTQTKRGEIVHDDDEPPEGSTTGGNDADDEN